MPTYEYICKACENLWEVEAKISDPPIKECPKCHTDNAKRLISGGLGFILQGGGWAKEGYRSK